MRRVAEALACPSWSGGEVAAMVEDVLRHVRAGDHVVLMSNGSFGGAHERVLQGLRERAL